MYWYLSVLNFILKSICLKGLLSVYFDMIRIICKLNVISKLIVYFFKFYLVFMRLGIFILYYVFIKIKGMLVGLLFCRFVFKYLWFFKVKGYWVYCYIYDYLKDFKFICI